MLQISYRYIEELASANSFTIKSPSYKDSLSSTYALVTIQLRVDDQDCDNQDPAALITLVHLPDQYCKSPPTILHQYLKFSDERLLNLKVGNTSWCILISLNNFATIFFFMQPLYSQDDGSPSQETNRDSADCNCVVCLSYPATKVLLPCRHACLCVHCFSRVDSCPVCRTRIISYFSVG